MRMGGRFMRKDMFSFEEEFHNEFGGQWQEIEDGATMVGIFTDTRYAEQLIGWFERFRCDYKVEELPGKTKITLQRASKIMEAAFFACDKFCKPENAHVTVQGILSRINPNATREIEK